MYSSHQKEIVEKIGPTASFLRKQHISPDFKSPRAMHPKETMDVCHDLFPKLGKNFYEKFLQRQHLILSGSISQYHAISGFIEIKFSETIKDVAAIAHEVGHANQSGLNRSTLTREIYSRLIQKKLDELTGDEDFKRDFFLDVTCDKRKFTNLFYNSNKGFKSDPSKFKYFTGTILAIPVLDAISNGQYDLESVADWHDYNTSSFMNKLGITHEKILDSVQNYIKGNNFIGNV